MFLIGPSIARKVDGFLRKGLGRSLRCFQMLAEDRKGSAAHSPPTRIIRGQTAVPRSGGENRVRRMDQAETLLAMVGWISPRTISEISASARRPASSGAKSPKSEATHRCLLPDDVGEVELRLATASVTDHRDVPPGSRQPSASPLKLSAHAIDNETSQHLPPVSRITAVSQALAREVDDVMFLTASTAPFPLSPGAGGGNPERASELSCN